VSQSNLATFCFVVTNHQRTAQILEVQLLIRYLVLQVSLKFHSVTSNECLQHTSAQGERIPCLPQTNGTHFKREDQPLSKTRERDSLNQIACKKSSYLPNALKSFSF